MLFVQILIAVPQALGVSRPVSDDDFLNPVAETIVTCNPQMAAGTVNGTVVVDIIVNDVVDLYGADIRMSFDTEVAHVVDAEPSSPDTIQIEPLDTFLSPDFVVRKVADNVAGTIWYAVTQINPSQPVSGSGALARVTFEPQQAGTFDMPIDFIQLASANGIEIPASGEACVVSFIEPDPVLSQFLPVIFGN